MNSIFSKSNKDNWRTPAELFEELNCKYEFTLDACADDSNHLCDRYYSKDDSCFDHSWKDERVFMNPPYGRGIKAFVYKAYQERDNADVIVALLPARTDTSWFHDYINGKAEVTFLRGRQKFLDERGRQLFDAPFPSMIVCWRSK
jgi:site-specific DNA-methyltransferase (adenine-specific)